jgi:hypothetical protein
MFRVFFDSEGFLLLYFKSCNETTSANNYYLTLQMLHIKIKNTCLGKLPDGIILLYETMADRVQDQLHAMWWEVLKNHVYSQDLFPCNFHVWTIK